MMEEITVLIYERTIIYIWLELTISLKKKG